MYVHFLKFKDILYDPVSAATWDSDVVKVRCSCSPISFVYPTTSVKIMATRDLVCGTSLVMSDE